MPVHTSDGQVYESEFDYVRHQVPLPESDPRKQTPIDPSGNDADIPQADKDNLDYQFKLNTILNPTGGPYDDSPTDIDKANSKNNFLKRQEKGMEQNFQLYEAPSNLEGKPRVIQAQSSSDNNDWMRNAYRNLARQFRDDPQALERLRQGNIAGVPTIQQLQEDMASLLGRPGQAQSALGPPLSEFETAPVKEDARDKAGIAKVGKLQLVARDRVNDSDRTYQEAAQRWNIEHRTRLQGRPYLPRQEMSAFLEQFGPRPEPPRVPIKEGESGYYSIIERETGKSAGYARLSIYPPGRNEVGQTTPPQVHINMIQGGEPPEYLALSKGQTDRYNQAYTGYKPQGISSTAYASNYMNQVLGPRATWSLMREAERIWPGHEVEGYRVSGRKRGQDQKVQLRGGGTGVQIDPKISGVRPRSNTEDTFF